MKCTNCGFESEAHARFCSKCGAALQEGAFVEVSENKDALKVSETSTTSEIPDTSVYADSHDNSNKADVLCVSSRTDMSDISDLGDTIGMPVAPSEYEVSNVPNRLDVSKENDTVSLGVDNLVGTYPVHEDATAATTKFIDATEMMPAHSYGAINPVSLTHASDTSMHHALADGDTFADAGVAAIAPARMMKQEKKPANREDVAFKKRIGIIAALLFAIAATVATIFAIIYVRGVEVPDLVGITQENAIQTLEQAGLKYDIHEVFADDNLGTVLKTDPAAGERVAHHGRITLDIATARRMPDVVGLTLDAAKDKLKDAGYDINYLHTKVKYTKDAQDIVLEQSIAAGEAFTSTTDIQLIVAARPKVPDIVGKTQKEAEKALEEVSLRIKVEWEESDEPAYKVLSCDPKPGTIVESGSEVVVKASSPGPSSLFAITDYLGTDAKDISAYMSWKKFSVGGSGNDIDGGWEQYWTNSSEAPGVYVWFTPFPFSDDASLVQGSTNDIMKDLAAKPAGVRMAISGGESATRETIDAYMSKCGLSGQNSIVTYDTITLKNKKHPAKQNKVDFICAAGTQAGYGWHILVVNGTVVVGAAPDATYSQLASSYENYASMAAATELFE